MFLAIDRVPRVHPRRLLRCRHQDERRGLPARGRRGSPYAIHIVITDSGMAFAGLPRCRDGPTARWTGHIFDRVCSEDGIEPRLAEPYHPWTTDEFEQPLFASGAIFLRRVGDRAAKSGARRWEPRRAAYDGRSSFAAPVRARRRLGPCGVQPSVSLR